MDGGQKRRRAAVLPADWEAQRGVLRKLYLVDKKPVKEIVEIRRNDHNFDASKSQYDFQFKKWSFRKNLREEEWHFIYRCIGKRKMQSKDSLIYLDNSLIPSDKIESELRRHVPLSYQCHLQVSENTPPGLFVCTPPAMALGPVKLNNLPWFQFNGFFRPQTTRPNQTYTLPAGQSPYFRRDSQDQTCPYGLDLGLDFEMHFNDELEYISAIQPAAESSLKLMCSIFGSKSPETTESSDMDHFKTMTSLLHKLEVDVPEFSTEEFKQKWEVLSWSCHADTILYFLELAVYLSSNNILKSDQTNAVFQWIVNGQNQLALDALGALVSSRMPTVHAFIHEIFRCALRNGHLHAAKTLLNTQIDFSEVLKSSHDILREALRKDDVKLIQFLLDGGVDLSLCDGVLHEAVSVEAAQLLLQADVDVNELDDGRSYGFASAALGNAALKWNFELAEFLIKEGADVNLAKETKFYRQRTPLRAALEVGDFRFIELLLNEGAAVDDPSYPWERYFYNDTDQMVGWMTPLQLAASRGDVELATHLLDLGALKSGGIEMVRLLLTHHADPNTPTDNAYTSTAIQIAAENHDRDAIQILMGAGAITDNTVDLRFLRAQLRRAIRDGCIDRARAILRSRIDISTPFFDQSTIIQQAIFKDNPEMVQLLVEAGADVNVSCRSYPDPNSMVTPLQFALEFMDERHGTPHPNAAQIVKILLDARADPNPPDHKFGTGILLQFAAALRDRAQAYDLVRLLLIAGASVNAPAGGNFGKKNALQLALLLDYGVDVNAPAYDYHVGGTALQIAVRIGAINLIQFLLNAGANVNAPAGNSSKRTVLQEAVKANDVGLVRFLLENHADVNSPAGHFYGRTALQQAIELEGSKSRLQAEIQLEEQRLNVVKLLMKKGADINAPPADIGGRTALQAAAAAATENSSIKLMQHLVDAGADVNGPAGAEKGLTALQGAAIQGHIKFALMLLEADADVNAPASRIDGRTALEGAAEHGRLDMVQLLINMGADSHLPGQQRYRTAATFAAKEGHFAVADLLKSRFEE
ncbi:ankyrin repeat-containing domain protein [Bisporella sp. PMI_857]|nr:ankyrin repeat-containing domain protein [Bisporella sp. PMI_857]